MSAAGAGRASPLIPFAVACLGIAIFCCMDALMKGLVLAIGTYSALFWRNLAGAGISAVPYFARPRPPVTRVSVRETQLRS